MKHGVIYQSQVSPTTGSIELVAHPISKGTKLIHKALRVIGAGMTSSAMAMLILLYGPNANATFEETIELPQKQEVVQSQNRFEKPKPKASEEAKKYGLSSNFSIAIDKIGAYSEVIENIDPFNKTEYREALQKGVAHAQSSGRPGEGTRVFLFAHSTDSLINISRYNALFYDLKKLDNLDRIVVFYKDRKYTYEVVDKVVVAASDTAWLSGEKSGEELVLQTCYPPGTTWKRLLVIAKRIS